MIHFVIISSKGSAGDLPLKRIHSKFDISVVTQFLSSKAGQTYKARDFSRQLGEPRWENLELVTRGLVARVLVTRVKQTRPKSAGRQHKNVNASKLRDTVKIIIREVATTTHQGKFIVSFYS